MSAAQNRLQSGAVGGRVRGRFLFWGGAPAGCRPTWIPPTPVPTSYTCRSAADMVNYPRARGLLPLQPSLSFLGPEAKEQQLRECPGLDNGHATSMGRAAVRSQVS